MVKSFKKFILLTCLCLALLLGNFSGVFLFSGSSNASATRSSIIQANNTNSSVSIFIRKPTYSIVYENKLYFIDFGDKLLKVCDIDGSSFEFENNYLDLSEYNIVDVCFCDGLLYLLVSQETISQNNFLCVYKIDLTDLTISKVGDENFKISLDSININELCVSNVEIDDKSYSFFVFTGTKSDKVVSMYGLVCSDETTTIAPTEITFESTNAINNLKKTFIYKNDSKTYLFFLYETKLAYYNIDTTNESIKLQNISTYTVIDFKDVDFNSDEKVSSVCISKINEKEYLTIYFRNDGTYSGYIKLFSFTLSGSPVFKLAYNCENVEYALMNENILAYPNIDNQSLHFVEFSEIPSEEKEGEENVSIGSISHEINNPKYSVSYLSVDEFVYKKTKTITEIFDNPWGASSDIQITQNTDVVKIGSGYLKNGQEIADYDYCMFTSSRGNTFGFIKRDDLINKDKISLENAGYKVIVSENEQSYARVSIWPNSSLYSMPTTSLSSRIGSDEIGVSDLVAEKIMQIPDNSEVFVLDTLCGYVANGVKMLKVMINSSNIGYIEERCVRTPSNVVDFVITNATIKKNNTKVYLSASSDSPALSFTLEKGKNIRINGNRDTKTGFTSITFNDEFGNEFSGYIETDYIKADSWSTLQIVGCVLIAINIGLLILILIFKNTHLGNHGQKLAEDEIITK